MHILHKAAPFSADFCPPARSLRDADGQNDLAFGLRLLASGQNARRACKLELMLHRVEQHPRAAQAKRRKRALRAFRVLREQRVDVLLRACDRPAARNDPLQHAKLRLLVRQTQKRAGVPLRPEWTENYPDADGFFRVYVNGVFAGMGEKTETGEIRFRAMLLPPINETLPK